MIIVSMLKLEDADKVHKRELAPQVDLHVIEDIENIYLYDSNYFIR